MKGERLEGCGRCRWAGVFHYIQKHAALVGGEGAVQFFFQISGQRGGSFGGKMFRLKESGEFALAGDDGAVVLRRDFPALEAEPGSRAAAGRPQGGEFCLGGGAILVLLCQHVAQKGAGVRNPLRRRKLRTDASVADGGCKTAPAAVGLEPSRRMVLKGVKRQGNLRDGLGHEPMRRVEQIRVAKVTKSRQRLVEVGDATLRLSERHGTFCLDGADGECVAGGKRDGAIQRRAVAPGRVAGRFRRRQDNPAAPIPSLHHELRRIARISCVIPHDAPQRRPRDREPPARRKLPVRTGEDEARMGSDK